MRKSKIVIGLGYGDEAKGSITSFLCSLAEKPLVIRFNGGHQAGHTVVYKGIQHKFSTFGSGTLQGVPTYWSKYCTFYPIAVANEHYDLIKHFPLLYVDPLCPVTTPFDVMTAQEHEREVKHGSCGVGFGQTLKRHEDGNFKLFVQDLYFPKILEEKLNNIITKYYGLTFNPFVLGHKEHFFNCVEQIKNIITPYKPTFEKFKEYIFEGAQGVMLDMDFGFFPHVTRSNTTSKNAMALIKEFKLPDPEIYYVSRCYQTRHGNGFMSNEDIPIELINIHTETNKLDDWQGRFRKSLLDIEILEYALTCDNFFSHGLKKNLVITCLDQLQNSMISYTVKGEVKESDFSQMIANLSITFDKVFYSASSESTLISEKLQAITYGTL